MTTGPDRPPHPSPGRAPGAGCDDERLSAWLDGGLDDDGNEKMADLAEANEDIARRAARLRRMDELMRAAVPEEDHVPDELLARLGLANAAQLHGRAESPAGAAEVIDLAAARAARAAQSAPVTPRRLAGFGRIAAQLVLISGLGLGIMLAVNSGQDRTGTGTDARYRTLSDASAAPVPANALVRFAPGVDAAEAAALARHAGADLVARPSASGTARLSIAPVRRDAVLSRLRASPRVLLAEPLDGGQP